MILLPLRTTRSCDLVSGLSPVLEEEGTSSTKTKTESDLHRLQNLRQDCVHALEAGYDAAVPKLTSFQEYASMLDICIQRGFPPIPFSWTNFGSNEFLTFSNWKWERANIIWNVAALTVYSAFPVSSLASNNTPQKNQSQWKQAAAVLEQAVSLLRYINSEIFDPKRVDCDYDIFFSTASLGLFQSWLCAQSQRCAFELFLAYPKPKHFVLAKLSIATLPFLQESDDASKKIWQWVDDNDASARTFWSHWADSVRAWQMYFTALTEYHQAKSHAEKSEMAQEAARLVAGIRFATLCRKHLDAQPPDDGQSGSAGALQSKVIAILDEMAERLKQIQREHHGLNVPEYKTLTPIRPQCMVKAGSNTAINPATLAELLPPFSTALFENVRIISASTTETKAAPALEAPPTETASVPTATSFPSSRTIHEKAPPEPGNYDVSPTAIAAASPSADPSRTQSLNDKGQQYIEAFQRRMELAWMNTFQTATESTERARRTLSQVNLPHALTQYQQEVASGTTSEAANNRNGGSGAGGLPQALWERVQEIQQEGKLGVTALLVLPGL